MHWSCLSAREMAWLGESDGFLMSVMVVLAYWKMGRYEERNSVFCR